MKYDPTHESCERKIDKRKFFNEFVFQRGNDVMRTRFFVV